jgi:hypothetical protein
VQYIYFPTINLLSNSDSAASGEVHFFKNICDQVVFLEAWDQLFLNHLWSDALTLRRVEPPSVVCLCSVSLRPSVASGCCMWEGGREWHWFVQPLLHYARGTLRRNSVNCISTIWLHTEQRCILKHFNIHIKLDKWFYKVSNFLSRNNFNSHKHFNVKNDGICNCT